ncbi:MAG: outer membrane beta-barrel protein, partial [Pseudomonadota bacterium]
KPRLTVSLTVGDEGNDRDRDDLSRTLLGGGVHLNLTTAPQWGVHLGYALQASHYGDDDPILLTTRRDDNHALTAGATYLVNSQWSIRGELSYISNQSNIELNDYDRTEAMLKLRYDFR